jgi:hypothetical protein
MGLDMYLIPKYEEESLYDAKEKFNEIAYWRKAYSLDQWFASRGTPIQDKDIYRDVTWQDWGPNHWLIKREQLKELIRELVNALDDPEHELSDVDAGYMNISDSVIQLIRALNQCKANHFIYYASR